MTLVPEGDTLFRTAAVLGEKLRGHRCLGAFGTHAHSPWPIVGRAILGAESHGKNCLIHFEGAVSLWTHLGLRGRWIWRAGAPHPRAPSASLRVALRVSTGTAYCHLAPRIRWGRPQDLRRMPNLAQLGPDLCDATIDAESIARAWAQAPERSIGAALLDQRAAAGIGNVYRSELLFLAGLDPWQPAAAISEATRVALAQRAHRLLRRNRHAPRRQTRWAADGPRLWVYDRADLPCLRCGAIIQRRALDSRSIYACPPCQNITGDLRMPLQGIPKAQDLLR